MITTVGMQIGLLDEAFFLYGEETALVFASKSIRRPIKWTCDRSEAFLSDAHGRDHVSTAELAMDAQGNFLALRVKTIANMGAYLSPNCTGVPAGAPALSGGGVMPLT